MKNTLILAVAIVLAAVIGGRAQTYGGFGFGTIAPTVASCPSGVTNYVMLCAVGTATTSYAIYVSYNAGPYQPLVPVPKVSTTVTSTAVSTVQ